MDDKYYYVYRLPDKLSNGFCYNGGNDINFLNVDWFCVDKLYWFDKDKIEEFIKSKNYYDRNYKFLVICKENNYSLII